MGNRRSAFVNGGTFVSPPTEQRYVVLVDVGIQRGASRVKEGETFTADPAAVAELASKGFIEAVRLDVAPDYPHVPSDPDVVMNLEPSE